MILTNMRRDYNQQYVVIKRQNEKCVGCHPSMSSLYRQSAPLLSVAITFPGDFFLFGTRHHLWKLQTNTLHRFWWSCQLLLCGFGPQRRWGVPSKSSNLLLEKQYPQREDEIGYVHHTIVLTDKMIPVLRCVFIPPQHWTATNTGDCALTLHRATERMLWCVMCGLCFVSNESQYLSLSISLLHMVSCPECVTMSDS